MSRKNQARDIFKRFAVPGRGEKKISDVYKYLTPEEVAEMEALSARREQLKEENACRAFAAMGEEKKNEAARRRSFYESARFVEIRDCILAQSAGVSQDDVHYFPEKYPFTSKEFDDFCSIIFERFEDKAESDGSPALVVREGGIKLTLFIGQGSSFYVERDNGPAPAPGYDRG